MKVHEKQNKLADYVYEKFREQLDRGPRGYYTTNLIWKENHLSLQNNKSSFLGKLKNLIRNLNYSKSLETYDKVMQVQIREVIVERVAESEKSVNIQKSEKIFYIPYRPVIRESAELTKLSV